MKVLVTAALLVFSVAAIFSASASDCRVCGEPITGEFFHVNDRARGGKYEVCPSCMKLTARCFSCGLPVKSGFTTLPDGRLLCTYCGKEAVLQDDEARTICLETRDDLDRLYSRFMTFPETNVSVTIVDRFALDALFKSPGYGKQCASVFGATRTYSVGGQRDIHSISILSGLSKPRLEAVAAHEFAHTWLNENLAPERKAMLSRDTVEGFCELIAFELMQAQNQEFEKTSIKENPYTAGQLDALLAAEAHDGFNAVLDWIKSGAGDKLDADNPDGVRSVRESPTGIASVSSAKPGGPSVSYSYAAPPPRPDDLTLKNIGGISSRRLAIINDRTFEVNDQAMMQLATSNVIIRCLEIRAKSVIIQLNETGAKRELFLPKE
jgi:hypothetical protein